MTVARAYFIIDANQQVKEYMLENTEWKNEDLEDFKEKMINDIFNTDYKFHTLGDCSEYVGHNAIAMAKIIDYTLEKNEFNENCKTVVDLFNLCWYFTADWIYNDEEWDDFVKELENTDH
jgi:hypothetical protein